MYCRVVLPQKLSDFGGRIGIMGCIFKKMAINLFRYANIPKSTDISSLLQVCLQLHLVMKSTHINMFVYHLYIIADSAQDVKIAHFGLKFKIQ